MAINSLSRLSIAGVGVPQVAGDFDKFQMDVTPKFNLGYKVELADGTIYRYCQFGDDVAQGRLVATDASESSAALNAITVIVPASANDVTDGTIGSKFIQGTIASIGTNAYAGGKLIVNDNTGQGYTYDVVGNTATDVPDSGDIRIQIAQPLQVALEAASDILIQGSVYNNLEIATSGTDISIVGVTCANMDVSEASYGWIQVWGTVGCLQDGAVAIGDVATLSDGTSGAYQVGGGGGSLVADFVAEAIVGYQLITGATDGEGVLYLQLG